VSLTVSQIPYEIVVTSAALKHEENIRRNFRYGLSEKKKNEWLMVAQVIDANW
jgi:hypothetical protein